ncbi:MAG: hypothetical protein O2907_00025 [Proteobacteria bacterium]|nr:hypothetical protein [Pseudomonadota bacterium]MDA1062721.1 hypothetical protein [Pseudomonadota bacterium]
MDTAIGPVLYSATLDAVAMQRQNNFTVRAIEDAEMLFFDLA